MDSATGRAAVSSVAPSCQVRIDGPISRTDSRAASNTANSMPGSYARMVIVPSPNSVRILGVQHSKPFVRSNGTPRFEADDDSRPAGHERGTTLFAPHRQQPPQ